MERLRQGQINADVQPRSVGGALKKLGGKFVDAVETTGAVGIGATVGVSTASVEAGVTMGIAVKQVLHAATQEAAARIRSGVDTVKEKIPTLITE